MRYNVYAYARIVGLCETAVKNVEEMSRAPRVMCDEEI